jgi:hypothetical protein
MIRLGATQITDAPAVVREESPVKVEPVRARIAPSGDASATLMEESFRTLRTNLLLRRESDTRTFVFTSAMPLLACGSAQAGAPD